MNVNTTLYTKAYQDLIETLVQERKKLSLTQKEVAKLVNINPQTIAKIEKMHRTISVCELRKLLRAYNVTRCSTFLKQS